MLSKSYPSNQPKQRSRNAITFVFKLLCRGISFVCLLLGLSVASWFGYRLLKTQFTQPEAMLVLGGATEREVFAAEFARQHPDLEIWVSGGSNPEYSEWVFSEAGIDLSRVHRDDRAVDTVTNFTTLVDELQARGIDSVYLITSDDHMRRSCVIGEIILGSRGIVFKPVAVTSGRSPEPIKKTFRDGARALLWVTTGHSGSSLNRRFEKR